MNVCVSSRFHGKYVLFYLPRGSSPSSRRQRTVGVGSPCTSQKKSTVSSANTTWFTGCLMKTGLSDGRKQPKLHTGHSTSFRAAKVK